MTAQDLIRDGRDLSVSDEVVFKALKEYLSDESYSIREIESLGRLMEDIRPNVMKMLRDLVLSEHKDCCGKDPIR